MPTLSANASGSSHFQGRKFSLSCTSCLNIIFFTETANGDNNSVNRLTTKLTSSYCRKPNPAGVLRLFLGGAKFHISSPTTQ